MNEIDIIEQWIVERNPRLMKLLLVDRSTGRKIRWATDNYEKYGEWYAPDKEITIPAISASYTNVVQPRVSKNVEEQLRRTKDNAEVFTPAWVCNKQNNLVDTAWFGKSNVFNKETQDGWETNYEPITFPEGKKWQDYVTANRMEISCGEAPYLVSRYDTVTGMEIPVRDRIGLLDRKFRVINENVDNKREWFKWVKKAYQSVYGYDYQGDNVLLARENLLYTIIDNRLYKFGDEPTDKQLEQIADIISWNIWQMDGLTYVTPYSDEVQAEQMVLFGETKKQKLLKPKFTLIYDWEEKKIIEFRNLMRGA